MVKRARMAIQVRKVGPEKAGLIAEVLAAAYLVAAKQQVVAKRE